MRCKVIVIVLGVLIDVYFTPFSCACSDQTSIYARACERDVCIRQNNLVVCLGK
jgi:hypothetical protein